MGSSRFQLFFYDYDVFQNPILRRDLCEQATSSSALGTQTFSKDVKMTAPIMQCGVYTVAVTPRKGFFPLVFLFPDLLSSHTFKARPFSTLI